MPRVSIWLPDELHHVAKQLELPISELAQQAIVGEVERRRKVAALDSYLAELDAELGPATPRQLAEADAWAAKLVARPAPRSTKRRSA